ncbi:MAG: hypothetical protein IPN16_24785 [Gemmatimonadetes bacterium]|nr:hypothetical protein [Gemmatimonadota bacterium]
MAGVDEVDAVVRDGLGLRWALMGPFGVANTNADGGVREYLTRFGGSISGLMNDLSPAPLAAELIERLGSATDAMVGDTTTAAQRAWRDRMVASRHSSARRLTSEATTGGDGQRDTVAVIAGRWDAASRSTSRAPDVCGHAVRRGGRRG